MKKSNLFLITALFLGAYLLSACNGVMPPQDDSSQAPAGSSQSAEAVFTGTVESQSGTQWLISGQLVDVDGATLIAPNIQVGDIVKVEASVLADGSVIAIAIETSGPDDVNSNDNAANSNDGNANDANSNNNTNSANDNSNGNSNDNGNNASDVAQEFYGLVEAITDNSISIGGVTYNLADFTEFKSPIAVGDQVKVEIIVNTDGTFTIREIGKSKDTRIGNDDSNSNASNYNGNDKNSNQNSNDDDHNDDNSNNNSNDDHDDDNSNGSNSNGD